MEIKDLTAEKLYDIIDEWSKNTFGEEFEFRPNQRDAVYTTIWNWLHDQHIVICSAPTGSGKSITAITVAGVLSDYFDMTGYILISDLSLLEQYEKDLSVYCPEWAVIKGQTNYNCIVNNMPYPAGNCHIDGYTRYSDILSNYQECSPYCEYLVQRTKAITSKVLVCTYSFWLLVQNGLSFEEDNKPYKKRNFTIADEAHKAVEIVQSHFSPKITESDTVKFNALSDMATHAGAKKINTVLFENIRRDLMVTEDKAVITKLLLKYIECLRDTEKVLKANSNISFDKKLSNKQKMLYINSIKWLSETVSRFGAFYDVIMKMGSQSLVKTNNKTGAVFNCLNDSYLMRSKFIDNAENLLFMSATLGDMNIYAKSISVTEYKTIDIPSTFDYSMSPIYYVEGYKMSYSEKESSFPHIVRMIKKILTMYSDKRGIIQTGSYDLAEKISAALQDEFGGRILVYNDSLSKREQLDNYKYSDNLVLIGPTLVEGISLDDDLARFLIVAKVPYASLADKYTAEKMAADPQWYVLQAAKNLLQGVGRGVRNNGDWCVSFILDSCFGSVLQRTQSMFPSEFIKRLQIIPATTLLN